MSWISYIALSVVLIEYVIGQEAICPSTDGFYPHPVDCDKYYRCVNGHGTEFQCAPETFWSSQTFVCSWKDDVTDCDSTGKRLRQSAYRSSNIEAKKPDNNVDGIQQQTSGDMYQETDQTLDSVTLTTDEYTSIGSHKTTDTPRTPPPSSNTPKKPRSGTTQSPAAFVASGQSSTTARSDDVKVKEDTVSTTHEDDQKVSQKMVTSRVTPKVTNQRVSTIDHTGIASNDDRTDLTTNDDHTATVHITAAVNITTVTLKPQTNASSNPVPMKFAARNLFSDFNCPKYFGFYRDSYNCRAYYHCVNGIAYKRHCPNDQYYDANIFNCGPKSAVPDCLYFGIPGSDIEFRKTVTEGMTGFRCPKDNGYYPDEDDCSYYYECILGHAYKRQCMVGTLFDRIRHKCTWENLVRDCAKLTTSTDSTTKVTNKIDYSFHCPKPDGYFRSLSDCRVYYHCIDNRALVFQCTPGSLFDIHLGKCTWFSRVYDCNEDGKPVSMDGRKQKEKNIPKKPVKDDTVVSYRSFKCPEEDGYFRDADDCAVYYFCTKWKVFQQQCKPGTVFSMEKLTCTWPNLVDCNSTGTAAPSTVRATDALPILTTGSPHRPASRDETRSTNTIRLENQVTATNGPTNAIQQRDQNYDYGYYYDNANYVDIDNDNDGDDGKNLPDINSITEAASISFVCPPVFDGYYGDPISCTKFYRCIGGKMYSFSCPTGTFFDNTRYICNFISEVSGCTSNGIRYTMIQQQRDEYKEIEPKINRVHSEQNKVEFIEPKSRRVNNDHYKDNSGESSFDRMPPGFKAVKLPCPLRDGVFAHPKSCTKFIFCKKFIPYIIDCPGDLVYNIHLHTCDYPDNVICKRYD